MKDTTAIKSMAYKNRRDEPEPDWWHNAQYEGSVNPFPGNDPIQVARQNLATTAAKLLGFHKETLNVIKTQVLPRFPGFVVGAKRAYFELKFKPFDLPPFNVHFQSHVQYRRVAREKFDAYLNQLLTQIQTEMTSARWRPVRKHRRKQWPIHIRYEWAALKLLHPESSFREIAEKYSPPPLEDTVKKAVYAVWEEVDLDKPHSPTGK